jgi:HK97 family phage portal protein
MGIFDRFSKAEKRNVDPSRGWLNVLSSVDYSGSNITYENSLSIATAYACIEKISRTIASLEKRVYSVTDSGRDELPFHPLAYLLNSASDYQTSSFEFWEAMVGDSLIYGRGFAYIEREPSGRPISLVYMPSPQVKTYVRPNGRKMYAFTILNPDGTTKKALEMTGEDVICVSSFRGKSPIELHKQNLGLAKSAENYGASFFGSGGHLSGVLMVDKELTDEQYQALKNSWNANYHGPKSNHATAILEHGIKYERFGIPPEQAQFIETRKVQASEIARIFGVPASIVGLESNLNYNSVEQQNIFFANYTIAPRIAQIENELENKLLFKREKKNLQIDFDLTTLMRGDSASRSQYISTLIRDGVLTINEARKMEGLNPVENGEINLVQSNLIPLENMKEFGSKLAGETGGNDSAQIAEDDAENASNQSEESEV